MTLSGYARPDGTIGARNHVLVLPSVVCSAHVAERIAGTDAVAIGHPHGCGQVGADAIHAAEVFAGIAAHPNVAGVLVVGLGCETVQGTELAAEVGARGQLVELLTVQGSGGSARTVERGRTVVGQLLARAASQHRTAAGDDQLVLGLDDSAAPFAPVLRDAATAARMRLVEPHAGTGPQVHADLAVRGAQVIVSWCPPGEAPRGFAVCPVVAVAADADDFAAMPDDFDLGSDGPLDAVAARILASARAVFSGEPSAAERRGAHEFELRRLTRSM